MDMNVLFVVTWSFRGRKKNWYRRLNWWFKRLGVDIYEFISNSPLCLKVHLKLSIDYHGEFQYLRYKSLLVFSSALIGKRYGGLNVHQTGNMLSVAICGIIIIFLSF